MELRGRNYFPSGKGKIKKKRQGLSCEQDGWEPAQARGCDTPHRWVNKYLGNWAVYSVATTI